jgi:carboxyl-terminal processing protease
VVKLKVVVAVLLSLSQVFAFAAEEKYNEDEATWRYSNFQYLNLDNLFKTRHCGKNVDFYMGCIAGLEEFAKLANPKNTLQVTASAITIVEDESIDEEALRPENVKSFYAQQRIRYAEIEKTFNSQTLPQIERTYLKLKEIIKTVEPYQVARAVNAAQNVFYDIHSVYKPAPRYNAARLTNKDSIVGLAYGRIKGEMTVNIVVKDYPAEKAGVKAGDLIIAIDGKSTINMSDDEAYSITDKKIGQSVVFKLKRFEKEFEVKLTFVQPRVAKPIQREIKFDQKKFSYIHFENFMNESLCPEVRKFLVEAQKKSAGVVFDLRGNPGGLTEQVGCLLGALIGPDKHMLYEKNIVREEIIEETNTSGPLVFTKPVVVLVNSRSASASEIFSGNLQAYARGLVLGERTFGKGTEQVVSSIERIMIVQTAFVYYFANGETPQLKGVTPDIETYVNPLPVNTELYTYREADIGIRPLPATPIKVKPLDVEKLSTPQKCLAKKNVLAVYQSLKVDNWQKDLQLLNGLAALSCAGQE